MCDALPGTRCSTHVIEKMNNKRASIDKTQQKIRGLEQDIDAAYKEHNLTEVGKLLETQDRQILRLQELKSEYASIAADYYTTPEGMREVQRSIDNETDPKQKAKLKKFLKENEEARASQKYSYELYQRGKENSKTSSYQTRLAQLQQYKAEYLKKHKSGEDSSRARVLYQAARDRLRLAEAGDLKAVALQHHLLGDVLKKNPHDGNWESYYAEVPNEVLVSETSKYFPHGNPLERVKNVVKDGNGYSVELESGKQVRTGVLMAPVYRPS